ncbi:MAG: hypothetical protein LBF97_06845, partial [Elusimicrobiota bacterium]|nr:hypothetical protein [Elusimicrobiota bacterium]
MSINKEQIEKYLYLAIQSYEDDGGVAGEGWIKLDIPLTSAMIETGYYGSAYYNNSTGEVIIGHRGTNADNINSFLEDFDDDYNIGTKQLPSQYEVAQNFYDNVKNYLNNNGLSSHNIVNVGHSLGGTLAQLVAIANGSEGIAFNSPGVKNIIPNLEIERGVETGIFSEVDYSGVIINFDNSKDIFSKIGEQVGDIYKLEINDGRKGWELLDNHDKDLLYNAISQLTDENFFSRIEEKDLDEYNLTTKDFEFTKNILDGYNNFTDFQQSLLENPLQSITTWLQEHNKNIDSFADEMKEIFGIEKEDF